MQYSFSFMKDVTVSTVTNENIINNYTSKETIKKIKKMQLTEEQRKLFSLAFQYHKSRLNLTLEDLSRELGYKYVNYANYPFALSYKRARDIADYFNMNLKDFISLGKRILKEKL